MVRPFQPTGEVIEQVGEVCFYRLVSGFGACFAGTFEFRKRVDPLVAPLVDGLPDCEAYAA